MKPMETQIKITNEASVCTIDIEGVIGVPEGEQFGDAAHSVATYERLREEIERIKGIAAEDIVVNIRSTGGDVNDALLIYESLTALNAKITTRCYGYTASAATIIAQAASEGCRELSANALYLIHRATCSTEGNADDLEARLALLRATDERLAALYADRAGGEKAYYEALMAENGGDGRWLTAEEAVEAGLADTIIGQHAESQSLTQNLSQGLQRLVRALGFDSKEQPQAEHNILHDAATGSSFQRRATMLLTEGQQAVHATTLQPTEDPSIGDRTLSANERAYQHDARAFRR